MGGEGDKKRAAGARRVRQERRKELLAGSEAAAETIPGRDHVMYTRVLDDHHNASTALYAAPVLTRLRKRACLNILATLADAYRSNATQSATFTPTTPSSVHLASTGSGINSKRTTIDWGGDNNSRVLNADSRIIASISQPALIEESPRSALCKFTWPARTYHLSIWASYTAARY